MLDYKNYVTDSDTGFNDLDSVQPVTDNETADQITFRRPPENLRYRSELVRKAFEELEAVVSSDRGLIIACGPTVQVTWKGIPPYPGGDGTFAITGELRLVPITNPATPITNNSVFNKLEVKRSPARFLAYSRARINEGGNNLQLEIFHVNGQFFSGNGVRVTVEGSKNDAGDFDPLAGPVVVRVQLSHSGIALMSTWDQVCAGINGMPWPKWIAAVAAASGATVATDVDRQYLWAGTGVDDVHGTAGCDAQTYRVTASEFVDFFADHSLAEGDALVLNFGSAAARLDQAGNVTLGAAGLLQIIHRDAAADSSYAGHANMMHAVPICKVVGDVLYFINGAAFPAGAPGTLGIDTGLRAELVDDGDGTGGVACGSKLVASDIQAGTHTPHNFNVGTDRTVFKQLGALLDWVNAHFNASTGADKHPLKDITARPFKTVGASGCDYTTIGAALTALCTGGVIMVTAGTYTSGQWDSTGYPISGPVDVIGMGGVVWAPSAAVPIVKLVSGQNISAPLRFHNVTFDRASVAAHTIELLCNSSLSYGTVEFYGCKFTRSIVSATYVHIRAMGAARLVLDHCDFTRAVQISDTTHIYVDGTPNVSITNCHFAFGANVVIAANTTMFTFEHNEVYSCGQVVVGDPTAILDLSADAQINVSIKNNNFTFMFGTATPSKEWGRMIDVQAATGEISGNFYENAHARYWTGEVPTACKYAITATGLNENRRLNVTGNNLDPGPCCGIRANNAMVLDNTIRNFYPRNSAESMYAIYLLGVKLHCRSNNINCAADSPANGGIFAYRCQKANISGNQIYGPYLEGITLEDCNYCGITNNDIVGIQGPGRGIFLATGGADTNIHNTVHGNRLQSAECIWVEGMFHIISNNTVRVSGISMANGITLTAVAGKYCVVQDNILFMNSGGTGAIHCAQKLTTIAGNLIYVAPVGILIEQELCTITGNTLHQCQVGIGLYAAACTKFTCTGNTIYVPDADNSQGITCYRAGPSATKLYGSITGNTIYRSGDSNPTGSNGIDLTFCDYVGCSGNTIGPYNYFDKPINTTNAEGVGLGKNLAAPNTDDYNLFDGIPDIG